MRAVPFVPFVLWRKTGHEAITDAARQSVGSRHIESLLAAPARSNRPTPEWPAFTLIEA
jgi:hypothetical protein